MQRSGRLKKAPVLKGILKKTSSTGRITIRKQLADSISIIYKNDTLGYTPSFSYDGSEDEIYSKEEYDDLNEFFDEHLRMEIFCDRGIYRPGQSVHYKIIFITNDPSTGKSIIFNRKNLGGGIFSNRVKQWLENGNNTIVLKDPSGRKIDSAILSINDFGSFSGSFEIPFKALTGEWRIDGHAEVSYYNSGSFRVEEYKPPTMEVQMEKPKKILRAGKPFSVAIKLRSLSGAQINNTPVKYTVSRAGYYPSYYQMNEHLPYNTRVELLHHTGYTDKDGILKIPVNDSALVNAELSDSIVSTFSYYIDATITDATGESVELHESLTLSTKPVSIYIPVNEVYEKGSIPDLPVATTAQFEGPVDRDVQIKLYRIENKSRSFNRERSVDQWYYDKSSWNQWFPDKAELPTAKEKSI
ncbi:MG2 domain-containing protein [Arcticibacter sp. MXS-1]|uniref:MG2 domain-containing protein n=1 Tax=Arcticibacter sp. MXS-1 TaxID=3341726 RepID=UPI0035A8DB12